MTRRPRLRLALVKPSPVLITESADEFSHLHDALKDEFKPAESSKSLRSKR